MLCESCNKRNATVHVTKILNGNKTELHLCEQCAKQGEEMPFDASFTINNFLTGLLDSIQDSPIKVDYIKTTKCDHCGMTYGKFKQLGRLGCAQCYTAFQEKLIELIKRVQGNEVHSGKMPKRSGGVIRLKKEIKKLKVQLDEVIRKEEFEKAAVLRDKIRELESQIQDMN
ncbi:Protein-arginine kinase activator protein McsA [Geosporobacter subterraneus DSM 17957]|uniref:Protein-arginine kinase activator protein McsA n=1 Tax=Geosporobacter subterraneus DSM 17957 TaxID=1121919 RepID=A0A1M6IP81_9FIRM|nr:UvrB/UvrC motif-containing protein [Geosporobacter subterraneus]SHJ36252.1 Protein-arginine kinase activator protein McsA [Geosporobacter subterraneus DSM 17957]